MATGLTMRVTLSGDVGKTARAARRLREARPFLRQVGVLLMSSAVRRLSGILSREERDVTTGRLMASLGVGSRGGSGTEDTVFEVTNSSVRVGTNVPYAAQRQYGGRILPKEGEALAIPLTPQLKRSGLSPRDIDPDRSILTFVPVRGGETGNVVGLLIDEEGDFGRGENVPLFAIARYVDQVGDPYLYVGDDDRRTIREELWPEWIGGGAAE